MAIKTNLFNTFLVPLIFFGAAVIIITDAVDTTLLKHISPTMYTLWLNIPSAYDENYSGTVNIVFTATETSEYILLHSSEEHIAISKIYLNGDTKRPCRWKYVQNSLDLLNITCNSHVEIKEANSLSIDYKAKLSARYDGGLYNITYDDNNLKQIAIFSQLYPTFARRVFPCFDEPNFKSVFHIFISYPGTFEIIGNTPIVEKVHTSDGMTTQFDETPIMSTQSLGFVISNFAQITTTDQEYTYSIFTQPELKNYAGIALKHGSDLINSMGGFTGIKYNDMGNPQLYVVATDHLNFGKENSWGLLLEREENLLDEGSKTSVKQKQRIIQTLTGEIAHQWFGNYITPERWSDVWLNEGFTTFLKYHLPDLTLQELETTNQFSIEILQDTLYQDSIQGEEELSTIENTAMNPKTQERMNKFKAIKGASIIRMMQSTLGEKIFEEHINSYLNKYKFNYTNPTNLLEAMELVNKMEKWLYMPGYPLVTARLSNNGKSVSLSQEPFFLLKDDQESATVWNIPITYVTRNEDSNSKEITWLKPNTNLEIHIELDHWIILNLNQAGYYRVNYDDVLWTRIINTLHGQDKNKIPVLNRAQLIDDIFSLARAGKVDYKKAFELLDYLKYETEYYPWASALRTTSHILEHVNDKTKVLLKSKLLTLINAAFPSVTEIKSSKHVDILKEHLILHWKCFLDDNNCLNSAKVKFEEFKNSNSFQNNNERDIGLSFGVRTSNNVFYDFNFLMTHYEQLKSRVEQESILRSLGCFVDATILENYLKEIVSEKSPIVSYDALKVFESVLSHKQGVEAALKFLEVTKSIIINKYSKIVSLTDFIILLENKITTQEQYEQLKNIVTNNEEFQDNRSIRSLKIIEHNLQWSIVNSDQIYSILEHFPLSGTLSVKCNYYTVIAAIIFIYFIFNK
ncbi:aminopeptidase N [Diabrotica virgifera virgifera]|uniref:Aminopeptidase n=1 Tax=Diabrotica virgifera virgifera TaxID=50390 RepID=A0ABM5KBA4_DIAVI|nr:aminopeptidase N [Diabrotica virgifera virgifera]XP_050507434.1 aminopeptidase N [Diabrotica virgifera virgifera]XP_050507469.1 aminopeptidase N [Diabrotica virgifera virgifera]